jgi:hypothetical protein
MHPSIALFACAAQALVLGGPVVARFVAVPDARQPLESGHELRTVRLAARAQLEMRVQGGVLVPTQAEARALSQPTRGVECKAGLPLMGEVMGELVQECGLHAAPATRADSDTATTERVFGAAAVVPTTASGMGPCNQRLRHLPIVAKQPDRNSSIITSHREHLRYTLSQCDSVESWPGVSCAQHNSSTVSTENILLDKKSAEGR